jgi:hypothetical protein
MNSDSAPALEPFKTNLLKLISKHDLHDFLWWNGELEFFINCNDVFAYAYADCEPVKSQNDVDALEQAIQECQEQDGNPYVGTEEGCYLFVARKRQLRPTKGMYKHINPRYHSLFDAAGPARDN